jgi:hypothetical protein
MGRCQTEASYLKSVLSWLQEYWTGPAVRIHPLKQVEQGSRHYSARRTHAALDRRDVIIDLPAFLAPRKLASTPTASKSQSGKGKVAAERAVA